MRYLIYSNIILFLIINNILSQELVWKQLGGPKGGIVKAMTINSKGDLFAGTYTFGISSYGAYKSSDNGETWIKLATEFPDYGVYSLLVTRNDHIWIGTINGRLYRSTDDGMNWEDKSNGYGGLECWALGESKSGTLFAGNADIGFLFRSTNYGESWQVVMNNIAPLSFAADSNNKLYMGTMSGLYYSTNNGLNWLRDNAFPNYFVSSILIDPNNIIYCATGFSNRNGDGVFYSTDNGNSWAHMGLSTKAILSLAFDSEGKFYAGSRDDGIYVTNDNGSNWTILQKGLDRKQISQLIINKNNEIFVGSEGGGDGWDTYAGGGVFRSTDNGSSFDHIGLPFNLVKNTIFSGDSLIITATLSGVQIYNRQTAKWKNIGLQNVEAVAITPSNYLYAGTDIGLFKKHISVEEWEYLDLAQDTVLIIYNVLTIDDNIIFASTSSNLRRSTDGGSTWQKLNLTTGTNGLGLFFIENNFYSIGYSSNKLNLFISTDMGSSFSLILSDIHTWKSKSPISVLINNNIFIASRGGLHYGILSSTNNGSTWQNIYPKENLITTIYANEKGIILSAKFTSTIYDTSKVIISTDFGATWKAINQPITRRLNVIDIKEDKNNKYYFGTGGEGLYEIDIITSLKQEDILPLIFSLSQNYPNPFNPSTEIRYQIAENSKVSLMVYDVLGNEVATLVNEFKSAGNYSVSFEGSKLSSGVYYYKLTAGDYVSVKKMMLMK